MVPASELQRRCCSIKLYFGRNINFICSCSVHTLQSFLKLAPRIHGILQIPIHNFLKQRKAVYCKIMASLITAPNNILHLVPLLRSHYGILIKLGSTVRRLDNFMLNTPINTSRIFLFLFQSLPRHPKNVPRSKNQTGCQI